ncbi:unnamed protein product [Aphanomyces euteiches]
MVGINIIAADTDEEAQRLATSQHQQFLNIVRGNPGLLKPAIDPLDILWSEPEKAYVQKSLSFSIVGSRATIRERLSQLQQQTQADEWIVSGQIYDHEARLKSYQIVSEIFKEIPNNNLSE